MEEQGPGDGGQPTGAQPIGRYFRLDRGQPYCNGEVAYAAVHTGMWPPFETRVLSEDASRQVLIDSDGVRKEILRHIEPVSRLSSGHARGFPPHAPAL